MDAPGEDEEEEGIFCIFWSGELWEKENKSDVGFACDVLSELGKLLKAHPVMELPRPKCSAITQPGGKELFLRVRL